MKPETSFPLVSSPAAVPSSLIDHALLHIYAGTGGHSVCRAGAQGGAGCQGRPSKGEGPDGQVQYSAAYYEGRTVDLKWCTEDVKQPSCSSFNLC